MSGSQEFTAVSKLYELTQEEDFDLLVLDTPPSRSAMDFFDAPGRLTSFLEGRALKAFLRPTGLGMRVLGAGAGPLLGGLSRITGIDLIADLTTIFALLGDMTENFSARAGAQVRERCCTPPETAFLLVTRAQREPIDEADLVPAHAAARAARRSPACVVNRFHHDPAGWSLVSSRRAARRVWSKLAGA